MRTRPNLRRLAVVAAACAVAAATALLTSIPAASAANRHPGGPQLAITTVSNPDPRLVSGGEVLVLVTGAGASRVQVTENGHAVSGFVPQPGGSLLGLVTGLRQGSNRIAATSRAQRAELTVIDHPISGPVFSGSQQTPFYCQTTAFGLAPSSPPLCAAPTVVSYEYYTTSGAFAPLADPSSRPANLATATVAGRKVPYIIRVETGTIDRAVYQIAALYDGSGPSPLHQDTSWNGKLIYTFGGGCEGGHAQGSTTGGVLNDLFLSQGYAVASSTLNVLGQQCNTILSAEAAMMVKEHFIDTYGAVGFTIGWGESGGAISQYEIADQYPGILNGLIPEISFPDAFTTLDDASDCRLLDQFFNTPAGASFSAAQRQEVAGFPSYESCQDWDTYFGDLVTASGACAGTAIPQAAWWSAANPDGVKCSIMESYANQFGRNPATGFVRSPLDSVGVQYGLVPLERGQISPAQFVALNAGIGGYNAAGSPVTQRTVADPHALQAAYRDDIINSMGLGLRTTPIIDQRVDMDAAGQVWDVHTTQWSFVERARLLAANGTAANQVIIESLDTTDGTANAQAYELSAMNQWLTNIQADGSGRSQQAKVIADKPAGLGDGCYLSATDRIEATLTDPATGPCAALYPVGSDPRQQAGEPMVENVLKCALKPLNFADYPVTFTPAEQAQLRQAFPAGVCDYAKPGAGQRQQPSTWLDYGDR